MVTSLVPSGNVPSTWISSIISGTPSMTSSRRRIVPPRSISSETERPSRIPSSVSAVIRATASGWFSLSPRARRRRATSAAVKMRSFSCSRGVRCIVGSPLHGEEALDFLHVEGGPLALPRDGALLHHVEPVAKGPGEFEILLDQHDGAPALALDAAERVRDLL